MAQIQRRDCYPCTLCCFYFASEILKKKSYEWCKHVGPEGCKIHEKKPKICRDFICEWAAGAKEIPEEAIPSKIKVVFIREKGKKGETDIIIVDEVYPGFLERTLTKELILAFAEYNQVFIRPVYGKPYFW